MEREAATVNGVTVEMPVLSSEPKKPKGFAAMSREKQREIAALGGKASHAKGTGHKWTKEEAIAAGRKGWEVARRNAHRARALAAAGSAT